MQVARSGAVVVELREVTEPVAPGNVVVNHLVVTTPEVVSEVGVRVLCGDESASFSLSDIEIISDLVTVRVEEIGREVGSDCGRVTLVLSVKDSVEPSREILIQSITIRSSFVFTGKVDSEASIDYEITIDGDSFRLSSVVETCLSVFSLSSEIEGETPYFSAHDAISYRATVTNNGRCSFFLTSIVIDAPSDNEDLLNVVESTSNFGVEQILNEVVEIHPGQSMEYEFSVESYPDGFILFKPWIEASITSSMAPESASIPTEKRLVSEYCCSVQIIQFNSIQFNSIQFDSIQFNSIQFIYLCRGLRQ